MAKRENMLVLMNLVILTNGRGGRNPHEIKVTLRAHFRLSMLSGKLSARFL